MAYRLTVTKRVNGFTEMKRDEVFADEADAIKAQCLVNAVAGSYDYFTTVKPVYPSLCGYSFSDAECDLLRVVGDKFKINAIKYAREVSGASLKDSKDWIEALTA